MKYLVDISLPNEPFSGYVRDGSAGGRIGKAIQAFPPEAFFFTDRGQGRGALMVVDIADGSQIPRVSEPWFLEFNASVHWSVAMTPDDLERAHLDDFATEAI